MGGVGLAIAVVALACGTAAERRVPETVPSAPAPAPAPSPAPSPATAPATSVAAPITVPPPAVPPLGAPVESLAAWSAGLPPSSQRDVLAVDGSLFVVDDAHLFCVSGDGTTPTLAHANPLGRAPVFADELLPALAVAQGALLMRGDDGVLAAIDLATLDVRWRVHRMDLPAGSDSAHLSSGDAFFVVARDELLALDPQDGHILWRDSYTGGFFSRGQRWRAAPGLFVTLDEGLVARDARTGATRWHVPDFDARQDRLFDPGGDRLPVLRDGALVIVSLADGSELARIALAAQPPWGRTVILRGDDVFVLVPTGAESASRTEVRRYDVARHGALAWRSASLDTDASGYHPAIALDEDSVLVCTTSWFARALGQDDGRERWSGAVDGCSLPIPWRPARTSSTVFLLSDGSDRGLARGGPATSEQRVEVTGTIRCGDAPAAHASLWVGGTRLRADASGHFRATTRARSDVVVAVDQFERSEMDFCLAEQRVLPVAAQIEQSFELEPGGGGGGGLI